MEQQRHLTLEPTHPMAKWALEKVIHLNRYRCKYIKVTYGKKSNGQTWVEAIETDQEEGSVDPRDWLRGFWQNAIGPDDWYRFSIGNPRMEVMLEILERNRVDSVEGAGSSLSWYVHSEVFDE